jgi:hypothetical protein
VKSFEEHAVGRRRLAAAESLARHTGVDYAVAYRHLQNGMARFLIESRGRAPRRRSSRSGLSPVEALYVLQESWSPPRRGLCGRAPLGVSTRDIGVPRGQSIR